MNDALKMQISAFVDGELPENESELLLRRLSQDIELRQQVAQYLEIGRLIRREREVPGVNALRDRIWAALGEEPVQQATETEGAGSKFTRPAVGVAIAASVAALALFTLRQAYLPEGEAGDIGEPIAITTPPHSQTGVDQLDQELLEQFYIHHDPRHVTWQLQDGALVRIKADKEPSDADEELEDDESED